jgi:hypothetical protein
VDLTEDSQHCGSCGGTCVSSGVDLVCGNVAPGACDCAGDNARCGYQNGSNVCDTATGLCVCDGKTCGRGEVCASSGGRKSHCTCNGSASCAKGQACCLGFGCADLTQTAAHCGACAAIRLPGRRLSLPQRQGLPGRRSWNVRAQRALLLWFGHVPTGRALRSRRRVWVIATLAPRCRHSLMVR